MSRNPETALTSQILALFGAEPDLYLVRNSVGVAREVDRETGKTRFVRYGLGAGTPDLVGMLAIPGTSLAAWVGFEIKVPGKKPRMNQRQSHAIWTGRGAMVFTVDSPAAFARALENARSRVSSGVETLVARVAGRG